MTQGESRDWVDREGEGGREGGSRGRKVTPFRLIECCGNVRTVLPGGRTRELARGLIIAHNKAIQREDFVRSVTAKRLRDCNDRNLRPEVRAARILPLYNGTGSYSSVYGSVTVLCVE